MKWEYLFCHSLTSEGLNSLGEQEWELVAAIGPSYAFKRPKPMTEADIQAMHARIKAYGDAMKGRP